MKKALNLSLYSILVTSLLGCSANEINAGIGIATNVLKGSTVTNEQLATKAKISAQAMDDKFRIAGDSDPYAKRLRRLTQGLQNYDGLNLNFKAYRDEKINAFAMPDGTVRVFSGLMDIMSDDELLAVIGHEIGHVKKEHSLKQYRNAYLARATTAGLAAYGGSTVSKAANAYGKIGLAAMDAQFSQRDELESDEYGVRFLHKLGRDPYAAVRAQQKLMAKGGGKGGFFSSHPSSKSRIEKATEVAKALAKK